MKINYLLIAVISSLLAFVSCEKDDENPDDSFKPTFIYTIDDEATLTSTTEDDGGAYEWDFGNGMKAKGKSATHTFTGKGTFTVTLTIKREGEAYSSSQKVTIDPSDEYYLCRVWTILSAKKDGEEFPEAAGNIFQFYRNGTYSAGTINGFTWDFNNDRTELIVNAGTPSENIWKINALSHTEFNVEFQVNDGTWVYLFE